MQWEAEYSSFEDEESSWVLFLVLEIPNGRDKRSIYLGDHEAKKFLSSGFEMPAS